MQGRAVGKEMLPCIESTARFRITGVVAVYHCRGEGWGTVCWASTAAHTPGKGFLEVEFHADLYSRMILGGRGRAWRLNICPNPLSGKAAR